MKFAIAVHGTRGDVEPAVAAGLELRRRGHEVRLAVPPNLVDFAQSAGLAPVASYGPDSERQLEAEVIRKGWTPRNPVSALRQARDYLMQGWMEMNDTLLTLADGADAILTGTTYQELAANVAEATGLPMAALHYFPFRSNNHILPARLPMHLVSPFWAVAEWAHWRLLKPADDEQRRRLGLPLSGSRAVKRLVEQGALEIQAYDKVFFPGLEAQWRGKRPLVGTLTLDLATAADNPVKEWIAAGPSPVYFGFGSMLVEDPSRTISMIVEVCRSMGQRALIVSRDPGLNALANSQDVMVVPTVNHSEIFPLCSAVVHHGGAGTTAASVRSGRPTLVLWIAADQPVWGAQIKRLGLGTSRRLSETTVPSLRHDLITVRAADCVSRAREIGARITPPKQSIAATATLIERLTGNMRPC